MVKSIRMPRAFIAAIILVVVSSGVLVERAIAQGYNLVDEVPSLPPIGEPVASPSYDGLSACDCCPECGRPCCACRDCCYCTIEKEKVKKHCWNVSCEKVCIPPVCMPKCCGCCWLPKWCCPCAKCRVRCISVLEQHEYECEECKCRWEVRSVPVNCGDCGCCDCCDCAATTNPVRDSSGGLTVTSENHQPITISSIGSVPTTVEDQPVTLISAEIVPLDDGDAGLSTTQQPASKDRSVVSRWWFWARSENRAESK